MTAADSFLLEVRVKPRAKRAGLLGWHGDALKVAVRAAPQRGKANAELLQILADALELPGTALAVVAGSTSQDKRIRITGMSLEEARPRLEAAMD
jgi:uncharacterized protein (TIGR00251 family)